LQVAKAQMAWLYLIGCHSTISCRIEMLLQRQVSKGSII
jgi:hypothetical protein